MFDFLGRPRGVAALAAASTIAIVASIGSAQAQEQQQTFNISAQPLSSALLEFSRQSNVMVGVDPALVRGKSAPAVQGSYTPGEALRRLLAGTGLRASQSAQGGFVLADNTSPTQLGDASGAAPSEAQTGAADILVVGRRTLNADIRRSEDDPQPYVVFNSEDIAQSGARDAEDFLRLRLPATTTFQTPSQLPGGTSGNYTSVELRSLGSDETLILVDGRRMSSAAPNGDQAQPDIRGIPLSAIERIEVLPSTASGIYGGGATGGVINIVLKRDYSGGEIGVGYGNTFDSAAQARRLDLSYGANLEDGRTNMLFSFSANDEAPLQVGERDFHRDALTRQLQTVGYTGISQPASTTTNVLASSNLVLDTGQALNARITFVPINYVGVGTDTGAGLLANAGTYNLALREDAAGERAYLLTTPRVIASSLTVRREMNDWLEMFVELAGSESVSTAAVSPSRTFSLLAADPGNPFQQNVTISTPINLSGELETRMLNYRSVVGAIFDLTHGWRSEFDFTHSGSEFEFTADNSLDYTAARAALRSGALNAFQDTTPLDFSPYRLPAARGGPARTTLDDIALRASGPLFFALPGGTPQLSLLAEHRHERVSAYTQVVPTDNFEARLFPREQEVLSFYGEVWLPIVGDEQHLPLMRGLDLQLSVRNDQYQTTGRNSISITNGVPSGGLFTVENELQSTDFTAAMRYTPFEGLVLRASYGTGFLPPSIAQLQTFGPFDQNLGALGITDPSRGGEALGVVTLDDAGSLERLGPEESESWSAGLVIEPQFLDGLRLSIDWTRIEKTDAILSVSAFSQAGLLDILTYEPWRVTRAAPAPGDPFAVGPVVAIQSGLSNFAGARVEAIDLAFDYEHDMQTWGRLSVFANTTYLIESSSSFARNAPFTDNSGVGVATGGPIWRAVGGLSWDFGRFNTAWTLRYSDEYYIATSRLINARQGSATIPSQTYHDLSIGYELGEARDTRLQLTIRNLFDEPPPLQVNAINRYSPYGDPHNGSYFLTLTHQF